MNKTHDTGAYIAELMRLDKSGLPADGGERFNRLIFARSPYLLQHAENPVDWYEWGQAAFDQAISRNVPILLSIGYATCHWCHVMAHESFEDEEVAAVLNRNYVCIKVDREERPDLDDFFMTVAQVLTGSGGWPLNVFLTPDRRPFFAVTYLPKRGRSGMSGLIELLNNISTLWTRQPERIEKNCRGIVEALDHLAPEPTHEAVELAQLNALALEQLSETFDKEFGGFGTAPKFPMPVNLSWLLQNGSNPEARKMAIHSLRNIRRGGIWDHIGGGLHRYAVDREWLVPHFEKMLYDQALVATAALEAYQTTADPAFTEMAENIFGFVTRELSAPNGGFYSALDADTEGVEGKFYIWDKSEVDRCLGGDAPVFCSFFDITTEGNFEGHSIANIPVPLEEYCRIEGLDPEETATLIERGQRILFDRRERRIRPLRDEKILAAWNGLMIAALAKGGAVTGKAEYIERAARGAVFVLQSLRRLDGRLLRSFLNGPSEIPAFLEDYAFVCHGLLELFAATLDDQWLKEALQLAEEITRLFYDPRTQKFAKLGKDAEPMPVKASFEYDGVMPSAFSMAASCFVRLGYGLERDDLLDLAHQFLTDPIADARRIPTAHLAALQAYAALENEPMTIRLEGRRGSNSMNALLRTIHAHLIPGLVVRYQETGGEARAFVCAAGTCHPPVSEAHALSRMLASKL